MITSLLGTSFIGHSRSTGTDTCGTGIQPGTGTPLEPAYLSATPEDVERAMALAAAFPVYSSLSGKARAEFLRAIATEIEGVVEDIVARGQLETALPEPRLRGETALTTGQLRLPAELQNAPPSPSAGWSNRPHRPAIRGKHLRRSLLFIFPSMFNVQCSMRVRCPLCCELAIK